MPTGLNARFVHRKKLVRQKRLHLAVVQKLHHELLKNITLLRAAGLWSGAGRQRVAKARACGLACWRAPYMARHDLETMNSGSRRGKPEWPRNALSSPRPSLPRWKKKTEKEAHGEFESEHPGYAVPRIRSMSAT